MTTTPTETEAERIAAGLTPMAKIQIIGHWPRLWLHHTHRRWFNRMQLIEFADSQRVRLTKLGLAVRQANTEDRGHG